MTGIKESREIIAATGAMLLWWRQVNADGKVSWVEWLTALKHAPTIKAAIDGASGALAELKDLDATEVGELKEQISAILIEQGVSHRTADITEELLGLAFQAANVLIRIQSMPPTAKPV